MKFTTLKKIMNHSPCYSNNEMSVFVDEYGFEAKISFKQILDKVGIKDAIWCLRTLSHKQEYLFLADVAELILPEFEEEYPKNDWPRNAIAAARAFYSRNIIEKELIDATASISYYIPSHFVYYIYTAAFYFSSSSSAACFIANSISKSSSVFWVKTEELFIKHFCEGE